MPLCSISSDLGIDLAPVNGYPKGRVIEIYGPESSGKTTLTLHAIAEAQKQEELRLLLMPDMHLIEIMPKN
jgi:RecA/RadA recombinase